MKADVKAKLTKALRSGRYKQTEHQLESPDGKMNCCLGVLCRVMRVKIQNGRDESGDELLSSDMLDRTGLTDGQQYTLSNMNDTGHSFREIADWIEENL